MALVEITVKEVRRLTLAKIDEKRLKVWCYEHGVSYAKTFSFARGQTKRPPDDLLWAMGLRWIIARPDVGSQQEY